MLPIKLGPYEYRLGFRVHGTWGFRACRVKVRTIIVTTTRTPRVKLPKVLVMTATSRSVAAMVTIAASITVSDDAAHGAHPPLRAPLNGGKAVLTLPPVYRGEGSGGPEDPGTCKSKAYGSSKYGRKDRYPSNCSSATTTTTQCGRLPSSCRASSPCSRSCMLLEPDPTHATVDGQNPA